ncbi:translation initiation factor eIF-2B subunit alpha-like isoform X2 [Pomacea canaliculata]|nr:translation initiation factor eIF-2B subunit alpha-like isoform X2 [Pomacea canaliculata]XP_025089487.1 translation initiation factor eIF-2B subunit alpha-like isoform X2 [Pomacea canaliculata]
METISELRDRLRLAMDKLTQTDSSTTSIRSGCELFLRFITLTNIQQPNFEECQKILIDRGNLFVKKMAGSRAKIGKIASPFIAEGATILTHSYSRVVMEVLKEAAAAQIHFKVFVTESCPNRAGEETFRELRKHDIPAILILDASVGYIMEQVDMVLVGAEGVVESGGIINKIGTYTMALSARAMNKPFYVVAESFKFVRQYPLNQRDVPAAFKFKASTLRGGRDLQDEHPLVDYTPPSYITLLFTDIGVLAPSAVSDELIKLYC